MELLALIVPMVSILLVLYALHLLARITKAIEGIERRLELGDDREGQQSPT